MNRQCINEENLEFFPFIDLNCASLIIMFIFIKNHQAITWDRHNIPITGFLKKYIYFVKVLFANILHFIYLLVWMQ